MAAPAYTYRCHVLNVVDGDTIDARIDLGFHITAVHRIRLLGVNAPEMRGPTRALGAEARDYVCEWITAAELAGEKDDDWPFVITTAKADAFGRWLGDLHPPAGAPDQRTLTAALLADGIAAPWEKR